MEWMIWTAMGCCAVAFVINMVLLVKDVKRLREAKVQREGEQACENKCPVVWHIEAAELADVIGKN